MAANSQQAQRTELKATVFISCSRKDMAFADRLEAALKARGFEALIDRTEIYCPRGHDLARNPATVSPPQNHL
jgi:hypothetical protein